MTLKYIYLKVLCLILSGVNFSDLIKFLKKKISGNNWQFGCTRGFKWQWQKMVIY